MNCRTPGIRGPYVRFRGRDNAASNYCGVTLLDVRPACLPRRW